MSTQAMVDVKTPVALTHASSEKLSRHEMLRWINTTVQGEYTKIEELCSGTGDIFLYLPKYNNEFKI